MGDREELQDLRRLAELEARAGSAPPAKPDRYSFISDEQAGHPLTSGLMGLASPVTAVAQMVGGPDTRQAIADWEEKRNRGKKLQGREGFDWYELAGSLAPGGLIAGGVSKALPAAGAIAKGVVGGAAQGALQPTHGNEEDFLTNKLTQIGVSGGVGGVIPAIGKGIKSFFGSNKLNPTQAATLAEGEAAGYKVPPSMVNPSGLNNTLESLAGKAAVGQESAARNQKITNMLAARALGLSDDTVLSPGVTKGVRDKAGEAYDAVGSLRPTKDMEWFPRYHQTDLVDQLKAARKASQIAWDKARIQKDSSFIDEAMRHAEHADSIQGDLEKLAVANGKDNLVKAMTDARTRIAKAHGVESALGEADSNISAPILGRAFDKKGGKAITGELATVGKMAEAFPSVMREGSRVPVAGVSGTDAVASAILGTMGYGAAGPAGLTAAALPMIRPMARNLVLSDAYQKTLAKGLSPQQQAMIDAIMSRSSPVASIGAAKQF